MWFPVSCIEVVIFWASEFLSIDSKHYLSRETRLFAFDRFHFLCLSLPLTVPFHCRVSLVWRSVIAVLIWSARENDQGKLLFLINKLWNFNDCMPHRRYPCNRLQSKEKFKSFFAPFIIPTDAYFHQCKQPVQFTFIDHMILVRNF